MQLVKSEFAQPECLARFRRSPWGSLLFPHGVGLKFCACIYKSHCVVNHVFDVCYVIVLYTPAAAGWRRTGFSIGSLFMYHCVGEGHELPDTIRFAASFLAFLLVASITRSMFSAWHARVEECKLNVLNVACVCVRTLHGPSHVCVCACV